MRHHSDHLSAPRARKHPKGSKSQSLLRDMHAPVGVIESRGHLRGGEINRKVLAMAYIPEKHKRYGLLPLSAKAMFDAQSREPEGQEMRFKIVDDRRALREKALTFDEHLCDRALEMLKVGIRGHATSSRKSILGTPCPVKRTSNQNRGSRRVLRKRKALSRLRACSLLCEPLSDRIGRQWRFSNAIGTRALARYGRSACGRAFTRATWQRASRRCHRPGAS